MPIISCDNHRQNCETYLQLLDRVDRTEARSDEEETPELLQLRLLTVMDAQKLLSEFDEIWSMETLQKDPPRDIPRNLEGSLEQMRRVHTLLRDRCNTIVGSVKAKLKDFSAEVFRE